MCVLKPLLSSPHSFVYSEGNKHNTRAPLCGGLETIPGSAKAKAAPAAGGVCGGTAPAQGTAVSLATAKFTPVITWATQATSVELLPGAGASLGSRLHERDHEDEERFSTSSFKECVTLIEDQGSLH